MLNRLNGEIRIDQKTLEQPASVSRYGRKRIIRLGEVVAAHNRDAIGTLNLEVIIGPLEVYPLAQELTESEKRAVFGRNTGAPSLFEQPAGESYFGYQFGAWRDYFTGERKKQTITNRARVAYTLQYLGLRNQLVLNKLPGS